MMGLFASIIFLLSFAGVVALFALKRLEDARGVTVLSARRARLDAYALRTKTLLARLHIESERIVPVGRRFVRRGLHLSALGAARAAEWVKEKSYETADRFSHKHHFERRETSSDFLKSVGEHPMRPVGRERDAEEYREA